MGGEAHNETEIHPQDLVLFPAVCSGGIHAERLCRAGGMDFSFLEMAAFCITGITLLFLAAEKGSSAKDKRNYFGLFVVLMLSYMGRGWAAYICSALVWPGLLGYEYQKGRPIQRQLQLVGAAEVLHLLFVLLTVYGGMAGLSFWANLLWVLLACARGWAALSLYKMQEDA